jgi:hypothetical protein
MLSAPTSLKERNLRKVDWVHFASILVDWPTPPGVGNEGLVEPHFTILYSKINAALDITFPKRIIKTKIKTPVGEQILIILGEKPLKPTI